MRAALLVLALLLAGCAAPDEPHATHDASPYAGQEARDLKALSPEDVAGYESGAGLGYAKSAELNHYPGPLHALQLADDLGLSEEQRRDIQRIREDMLAEAVPLGRQYLEAEAAIERAFREGDVTAEELRALVERAADVEAQLRFVHLDAHITTRALMTPGQVMEYDALRGYSGMDHAAGGGHGHS